MGITRENADRTGAVPGKEANRPKETGFGTAMSFHRSRVSKFNRKVKPVLRSRGWGISQDTVDFFKLTLAALLITGYTFLWGICYFGLIIYLKDKSPYTPFLVVLLLPTYWLGMLYLQTSVYPFKERRR
jgi:hypothetical protein